MRIFTFFLFFSFSFSQGMGIIDGVLAIVDNNVILRSDIEEQVFLIAKEKNISPQKTPLAFQSLYEKIIEEQIDRKVVLSAAKQDSLIEVTNEEINKTLNQRIDAFVGVFGSKEALEDTMKMSVNAIKNEYYKLVEEELFVEKFRFLNFNNTFISRQDVISFFENNPDSFPSQNPKVDFSVIQHPVELSSSTKDSILFFAKTIKDSINKNLLSFEAAAKRYSQDPGSAQNGGSLGYTTRGTLLKEYEQIAFNLEKGEISSPVESLFGFHIIKLRDRLGEKINTQHILFSLKPGKKDLQIIKNKILQEKNVYFDDPASFDSLAVSYRSKYNNLSGYYVDFDYSAIPVFLKNEIEKTENYSFSRIFEENGFLFLIYKYKISLPQKISLEKDWSLIESFALSHKNYVVFKEWIKNKKKEIYIKKFY
tara:strand:- start:437 stop:1705 length:1269 start_codon:yes stop_codon:yes gene_type:complete